MLAHTHVGLERGAVLKGQLAHRAVVRAVHPDRRAMLVCGEAGISKDYNHSH